VLTTDTGLAITGDSAGNVLAIRTTDGSTLWHENIGRMGNPPVTFMMDGQQYLLLGGGNSLFAYALQ
jgi:alcohol dehydrogenase (cytochrome c)